MHVQPSRRRFAKRGALVGISFAFVAGFAANGGPPGIEASSHREAPLIAGDPQADNTDLYAFVSPDDPDTVTLIANWIPFEEPNGGPNFYPFADDTKYSLHIDNDGDALPDVTYDWVFDTVIRDPGTFLYNTGPVTSVTDPTLNYYQTYDLTVTVEGVGTTTLLGDGDGVTDPTDPVAAPSLVGPGSIPDYQPLVDEATYDIPGGGQTYVGQADDPFFLDLRVFDLLYGGDLSEVGEDTLAGYNVNTIALQVPKTALAGGGLPDDNPVIGVWSTTSRRSDRAANGTGDSSSPFVQVSRLGNPLVNEVVFPLALKDAFNSISPDVDATVPDAVDAVTNPILPPLIEAIYGVPAPDGPRHDLEEIFLQGISAANAGLGGDPATVLPVDLNGHDLNATTATLQPSEQLRLNMSIEPSANPNRLGLLAGQLDGFPNGRRLQDDVVDIAIQTVMGAAQTGQIVEALATGDRVDRNDREFRDEFPYVALPHSNAVNRGVERSPRAPEVVMVNPERVLDTRADSRVNYTGPRPAAGATVPVKVTGVGTSMVPASAQSVIVNVTAINARQDGFVAAYDCDDPRPATSNLNPRSAPANAVTSNMVVADVSAAGTICLFTNQGTDLIVDLAGYVPAGGGIVSTTPERALETRASEGQIGYSGPRPAAGSTTEVDVTGLATSQVPANAKAVVVNVTSVNAAANGFVTAFECGTTRPTASTLNARPGTVRPNFAIVTVGDEGTICLYSQSSTDLIVDVFGYVPATSEYTPTGPVRILETREEEGQIGFSGTQPSAGRVIEVRVAGTNGVPSTATAAVVNVTTTNQSPNGFVTVFSCGEARPTASTSNLRGTTTPSGIVTKIGEGGRVCIYVSQPTDVIVDLVGFFPGVLVPQG